MPDNTEYIELDISESADALNPAKTIDVVYAGHKKTSVSSGGNIQDMQYRSDWSDTIPEGYVLAGYVRNVMSSNMYNASELDPKANVNSKSEEIGLVSVTLGSTTLPASIGNAKATEALESGVNKFVERTVTFLVIPEECLPLEE